MADLIVPSYCEDLAEFTDMFAYRVEQEDGLLILYGPHASEVGERVNFQVLLSDGEPALAGIGSVHASVDAGEDDADRDETNRYDIFLEQLELDARSEIVMERLMLHRTSLAAGEEGTAEVALSDFETGTHSEVDLDGAVQAAIGGDEEPSYDADGAEAAAAEPPPLDLEPMDSGEFGDSMDDIAISAAQDADDDFSDDEPTAYEIPAEDDVAGQDEEAAAVAPEDVHHDEAASATMEEYEAVAVDGDDDLASVHTVIDGSAMDEAEGDDLEAAPVADVELGVADVQLGVPEEVTGEVSLEEFELWDDMSAPAVPQEEENAPAGAASEFFAAAVGGVGLIRPSVASSWQPSVRELHSQVAGGMFTESAGLPVPASAPRPEIDPALGVAAVGSAAFKPSLVMLTEGQPVQFEAPPPVPAAASGSDEDEEAGAEDVVLFDGEAQQADSAEAEADGWDEESASIEEAAGYEPEEFVAVETGGDMDLGQMGLEGDETQAVEMPPFEEGDDLGIDVDL